MKLPPLIKNRRFTIGIAISILLVVVGLFIAGVKFPDPSMPLIIHVSHLGGINFVGNRRDVFGILITGLLMIVLNILLANRMFKRVRSLAILLVFGSVILSLLIFGKLMAIISIN